jgi:type IV pilus assembly protein PilB
MNASILGTLPARKRIGERLLGGGQITPRQLAEALQEQQRTGALLGETLVRLGHLAPRTLGPALAAQAGLPWLDLAKVAIAPEALALVPEPLARRLGVLPVALEQGVLRLAMANVFDLDALAQVEAHCRLPVAMAGAAEEDLRARLALAYGDRTSLDQAAAEALRQVEAGTEAAEDPPITRLVDQLLLKALRDRATDLHLQPGEQSLGCRYRVDGALVPGPDLPKALQAPVTARLKVLAGADLAESRRPQDGKFRLPGEGRTVDVRASFLPVQHGEKVVLRFLDQGGRVLGLEQLGMPAELLAAFTAMLERPHGMLLVTGPTGSGKTTTLYSALQRLNTPDRCLVTVEDPVEYELAQVAQFAVNPKAGLTFASGLRAILRQDPDIILVGEIRDAETAGIAFRAAMTGHLVLTTLHTGDPVGAIPRLRDLGIGGLDLATAVLGIHAQRLVRLICPHCAERSMPAPEALAQAGGDGDWRRGAGCLACGGTGVRGRRAVHDLLPMTPQARELVAAGAPPAEVEALARRQGKASLREHAVALARAGAITLDEALRVTAAED